MNNSRGLHSLAGLVLIASLPALSVAGSFAVNPVRLSLSAERFVDAISVSNQGAQDAVLQVETTAWTQSDGQDVYTATNELLVNPPIFTVPAGGTQIVRVGLTGALDPQRERAYRVFFQEVPSLPEPGFKGLRVLLRIGVPVFVEPSTQAIPILNWQAKLSATSTLNIVATNIGNAHVRIVQLRVSSVDGRTLATRTLSDPVLAEQSRAWVLDLDPPPGNRGIRIVADTSEGKMESGVIDLVPK
ncbi:MAG: fimbrial biogenesis chaperone [Methylococcales bacterium]